MSKHTPGPWEWVDARTMRHLSAPESERKGLMVSMPRPSNKCYHHEDRSEDDANARLISAAPDLLAACEKARKWIDDGMPAATQNVLSDLESALAKAGGV